MNAVTIQMPDEMLEKVTSVAKSQNIPLEAFILDVMDAVIREDEARKRFLEYAERGRGREQEALALLRR
jgi:predicted transcriptional regulator